MLAIAFGLATLSRRGEGGTGLWGPWYNATVQDTATDPHTGSAAIAVSVTGPYGWGIAFTDYPGVPAPAPNSPPK